jgi:ribosome modulation factor
MDAPISQITWDIAQADGFKAHRAGLLLAQCPWPAGAKRRAWRAGWLEREEAFCRTSRLDVRRNWQVL